jgi:hypothetical protein
MNMIRHETIAHHGQLMVMGIARQQVEINDPVDVVGQNELPGISALVRDGLRRQR